MQVVKMLCIFIEIFRERSVHFISTAEALITWPQIQQFVKTHLKRNIVEVESVFKAKTTINDKKECINLNEE